MTGASSWCVCGHTVLHLRKSLPTKTTQQHNNTTTQQHNKQHNNTTTQQHNNTTTQQHSNTATQQHSNTATQQHGNTTTRQQHSNNTQQQQQHTTTTTHHNNHTPQQPQQPQPPQPPATTTTTPRNTTQHHATPRNTMQHHATTTTRTTTTPQQQQAVYPKRAHFSLCVTCDCEMDPSGQPTSAAQRRRGRRLRAALRHERQSIAIALAELTHHSSRGQRMARAVGWVREVVHGQNNNHNHNNHITHNTQHTTHNTQPHTTTTQQPSPGGLVPLAASDSSRLLLAAPGCSAATSRCSWYLLAASVSSCFGCCWQLVAAPAPSRGSSEVFTFDGIQRNVEFSHKENLSSHPN